MRQPSRGASFGDPLSATSHLLRDREIGPSFPRHRLGWRPWPLLITGVALLGLLSASCGGEKVEAPAVASPEGEPPAESQAPRKVADGPLVPELMGISAWINSDPLTVSQLRGKVVLVDFWTYTCINCIRTFPFLKLWHSRYADDGLVILGIHTPEFEFEEDTENVRNATFKHGITWPVAQDNDYATWDAFRNRFWPAKYLVDQDGVIRYTHFGEGNYAETEEMIRDLLVEAGADLSLLDAELPKDQVVDSSFIHGDPSARPTPELYGGWKRGCSSIYGAAFVAQPGYCSNLNQVVDYVDPGNHIDHGIYLNGPWFAGEESLRFAPDEELDDYSGYMSMRISAKSANAVITPEGGGEPFKVLVTLDGDYLTEDNRGEDVVIEVDGRSFLIIDQPRLYRVVEAPRFGTYDLKLSSNSPQFAVFAFTFGVYESGA